MYIDRPSPAHAAVNDRCLRIIPHDIVQEMSGWADSKRTVAIYRQAVPVERVLMTYLETEAMNHPYREAEAVLLADPSQVSESE